LTGTPVIIADNLITPTSMAFDEMTGTLLVTEIFTGRIIAIISIFGSSLIKEPKRRNFMAIMLAGAGAAYLSGGGLGKWEFAFTAVITYCAYKGLHSYRFIGLGWILHTVWDITHHFYGAPIIPFLSNSSAGCAITDAVIALWFFANAPSVFEIAKIARPKSPNPM
jgi:hypothetical protein